MKIRIRVFRLLVFLCPLVMPVLCSSQDWLPMDLGFKPSATGGVNVIRVNPVSGDIFAGGDMLLDGRDSLISAFTRWNRTTGHWEKAIPSNDFAQTRHIMFFEGEMYAGLDGGLSRIINGVPELFEDGPAGTLLGSAIVNNVLYIVGGFYEVGAQPSYGIAIYNGEEFSSIYVESNFPFGPRLDDVEEFQGEVYVVGKTMYSPFYLWDGFAKISEEELAVAHEEFTGTFSMMWVFALEEYQGRLYIGGLFHNEQGFTGNGIQSFDGTDMFEVGGGVNATVQDMMVYEGELYVVGGFSRIGVGSTWAGVAGELCYGVAKWNGETWTCLNTDEPTHSYFETLDIYQDTLYVGGSFHSLAEDTTLSLIARKRIYPDTTLVSIDEESNLDFSIYPNPSNGELNIDFGQTINDVGVVRIFNSIGQLVLERNLELGYRSFVFNSHFPQGLYTIQVQLGESTTNKKIVLLD